MKGRLLLAACVGIAWWRSPAYAHDYGLTSIDRSVSIKCENDQFVVFYVEDIGEILSLQEINRVDADGDGKLGATERAALVRRRAEEILSATVLENRGFPVPLTLEEGYARVRTGDVNLPNILIAYKLSGSTSECPEELDNLTFVDNSYSHAPGNRYVTLTVAGKRYSYRFSGRARVEIRPPPMQSVSLKKRIGLLLAKETPAAADLVLLLGIAFILGFIHSISPGHGKALMAAYFAGHKGTTRNVAAMALSIVLSHTAAIYLLAIGIYIVETNVPVSSSMCAFRTASGILVVVVGLYLLWRRWREMKGVLHLDEDHALHVSSYKENVTLGLSYGLAPCPTGIAIVLAAASVGHSFLGLMALIGFSFGLGVAVFIAGLLFLKGAETFRSRIGSSTVSYLPLLSAMFIVFLGILVLLTGCP